MKKENTDELILKLREIAGEIGSQDELENGPDAENYDFQVMTGLAEAVVEIMDHNPEKLFHFLGYCLIDLGPGVNERILALKDALQNEVISQLDAMEDEEGNQDTAI